MKTKKNLLVACFVGLALTFGIAGAAFAGPNPGTGITDSPHDLASRVAGEDRICAFCHTPHHATDASLHDYMPLWSRDLGPSSYTGYASSTYDAGNLGYIAEDQLRGPSRLCMSCHDGSIAIDAYYGSAGNTADPLMTDTDEYGHWGIAQTNGLSNDHPIGFDYEAVAQDALDADGDPLTVGSGLDKEIVYLPNAVFDSGVTVAEVLYEDTTWGENVMTCSTCHDVHNTKNNEFNLLYGLQADSSFCLTCHAK